MSKVEVKGKKFYLRPLENNMKYFYTPSKALVVKIELHG